MSATAEAVGLCLATRTPVLLWGAPGTGKTSAVRALWQAHRRSLGLDDDEYPLEVVLASIREPSDFSGLPVVTDGGVAFSPPRWAVRLAGRERAIAFLDEISTAPPAVQAALLRVVFDRVVGDLALGDGVAFVAAANPVDSAAGGWDLSSPLANRFVHIRWQLDPDAVIQGIVGGFRQMDVPVAPAGGECTDDRLERGLIGAFLAANRAAVHQEPSDPSAAGGAWPSPRTWEMLARLLAAHRVAGASVEARNVLIIGCVGQGCGPELMQFLDSADLPDPDHLLADPSWFDFTGVTGDRVWAILGSLVAAFAARPSPERWAAAWVVLGRVYEQAAPDIAAVGARMLIQHRPGNVPAPPALRLFIPMLIEAGLLGDGAAA